MNKPDQPFKIASPCPASWEGMSGDDRKRFCAQCKLHVHNLSAMERQEAEQLLQESAGRLCHGCVAMSAKNQRREVKAGESLSTARLFSGAGNGSVAGTWDSNYGHLVLSHLKGDQFSGSYGDPGGTHGSLLGTLKDGRLSGQWQQPGDKQGSFEFRFEPETALFLGGWSDGDPSVRPWFGSKSPASAHDFCGHWSSSYGAMWVAKTADGRFIGTYSSPNLGAMEGRVVDGLWSGTWTNVNGAAGRFELRLAADAASFDGLWHSSPAGLGQPWKGTREK